MLDESLLDSPEALAHADTHGLLRAAAEAGAHVRTAVRSATDSGLSELHPDGRPRAVLVAGPGPATACAADMLGALTNGAMPVTLLRPYGPLAVPEALRWALPGWAGALDLLLVATPDGAEPGLTVLIEQAYRRGCTVVTVSPPATPAATLTGETHGLAVPLAAGPVAGWSSHPAPPSQQGDPAGPNAQHAQQVQHAQQQAAAASAASPAVLWSLLTPLLVLSDKLGLFPAEPSALQSLADRLDHVAERCGPATATYSNPAKSLAAELTGSLPLLWSEGGIAGAVARHGATTLAALPGLPALTAELPEAMAVHSSLLSGALAASSDPEDFFRDRVEEPESLRARIVLLREQAPFEDSAVVAVRDLAYAQEVPLSELEPVDGSNPLEAVAELIATVDFAAVYLSLADGGPSWS